MPALLPFIIQPRRSSFYITVHHIFVAARSRSQYFSLINIEKQENMRLTKRHKEELIVQLKAALELKATLEKRLNSEGWAFCEETSIELFLAEQRLKLIEASLASEEIDF